jgi:hypothetical protein
MTHRSHATNIDTPENVADKTISVQEALLGITVGRAAERDLYQPGNDADPDTGEPCTGRVF